MKKIINSILYIILSTLSFSIIANSDEGEKLYLIGTSAFNNGEYKKALQFFNQSLSYNLKKEKIFYSIGSSHYRLEQYNEAYIAFEKASQHKPLASAAQYSMGLASIKNNNNDKAIKNFLLSFQSATNETQKNRALRMLNKLKAENRIKTRNKWNALIISSYGYTNNTTNSNPEISISQDNISSQYQHYFTKIGFQPSHKWKLYFRNTFLNYNNTNTKDYLKNDISGKYKLVLSNILLHINANSSISYLNGNAFQGSNSAGAEARYTFNNQPSLTVNYHWSNYYQLDKRYSYLNGTKHQLSTKGEFRKNRNNYSMELGFELNNRRDFYNNGLLIESFSPKKLTIASQSTHNISKRLTLSLMLKYSINHYQDANRIQGGETKTRIDTWYRAGGKIQISLLKRLWLVSEYYYTKNRSNIISYRYDSGQISTGFVFKY